MMNIQIASHFVLGIILYETFSDFQRELDLCRLKHEITLSHVSSISMDLISRANKNIELFLATQVVITVKGVSTYPSPIHPLHFLLKSSSSHSSSENRVSFETEVSQLGWVSQSERYTPQRDRNQLDDVFLWHGVRFHGCSPMRT